MHLVGFQSCANTIFRTVLFRSPSSNFPPIMKNFSMTNSRVLPGRISSRTFSPQTAFRYCSRVSCGSWFISSCYLPSVESHDKLVDFALQPGCCHSCMPFSYVHYCHKHFTSVLHLVRILSNRSLLLFFFIFSVFVFFGKFLAHIFENTAGQNARQTLLFVNGQRRENPEPSGTKNFVCTSATI